MGKAKERTVLLCIVLMVSFLYVHSVQAQSKGKQPVDLMVLLDNSCSMFPHEKILPGCESWGSDPDYLRILGTDMFLAGLGFADEAEGKYQLGIVSFGEDARMVSKLQPIKDMRGSLARAIKEPKAESATQLVPGLNMAINELRSSPNRKLDNIPAIVVLTDGMPYPEAGQSQTDIENIISNNSDIPVFFMLLKNPDKPSETYNSYIKFWMRLQARYKHVFVYEIENASQIEATFNQVMRVLNVTTGDDDSHWIGPEAPYEIYINKYVQSIRVTVNHGLEDERGKVEILDPDMKPVTYDTPGVLHMDEDDNPIEMINISDPRLSDALKGRVWTIRSTAPVTVFVDLSGAYRVNFLAPEISPTESRFIYLARQRVSPSQDLKVEFTLVDSRAGTVITDPQPIHGSVILPDGVEEPLLIPSDLKPDAKGVYTFTYNFQNAYPAIMDEPGQFRFILNAGDNSSPTDTSEKKRVPISTARLVVNVGRAPFVSQMDPQPLVCSEGVPASVKVKLTDAELASPGSIILRVITDSGEVNFTPSAIDSYSADMSGVCAEMLKKYGCGPEATGNLRLRLTSQLLDGKPLLPQDSEVKVTLKLPACPTATAMPTALPTATLVPPPPKPPLDGDKDGVPDALDKCPTIKGSARFDGCPLPLPALWSLLGLGIIGLLALLYFVIWPRIQVSIWPPARAYMVATAGGTKGPVRNIYSIGMTNYTSKVTIGGEKGKSHIYIDGLRKPVEFEVVKDGNKIIVFDTKTKRLAATVEPNRVTTLSTSNLTVTLRFALDQTRL